MIKVGHCNSEKEREMFKLENKREKTEVKRKREMIKVKN